MRIDQTHGRLIDLYSGLDASGIHLASTGSGTDLAIVHAGSHGMAIDVTNAGLSGAINVANMSGQAVNIAQYANKTALSIDRVSTGGGKGLEVNYHGNDVGLQVNNDGTGSIGLHISHVGRGDSTVPALSVFVGGRETGPALYIDKAADSTECVGQVVYLWNQAYSETIDIHQDRTDSSATVLQIDNKSLGFLVHGLLIHAINYSRQIKLKVNEE
jgi:hypothetical protein